MGALARTSLELGRTGAAPGPADESVARRELRRATHLARGPRGPRVRATASARAMVEGTCPQRSPGRERRSARSRDLAEGRGPEAQAEKASEGRKSRRGSAVASWATARRVNGLTGGSRLRSGAKQAKAARVKRGDLRSQPSTSRPTGKVRSAGAIPSQRPERGAIVGGGSRPHGVPTPGNLEPRRLGASRPGAGVAARKRPAGPSGRRKPTARRRGRNLDGEACGATAREHATPRGVRDSCEGKPLKEEKPGHGCGTKQGREIRACGNR